MVGHAFMNENEQCEYHIDTHTDSPDGCRWRIAIRILFIANDIMVDHYRISYYVVYTEQKHTQCAKGQVDGTRLDRNQHLDIFRCRIIWGNLRPRMQRAGAKCERMVGRLLWFGERADYLWWKLTRSHPLYLWWSPFCGKIQRICFYIKSIGQLGAFGFKN